MSSIVIKSKYRLLHFLNFKLHYYITFNLCSKLGLFVLLVSQILLLDFFCVLFGFTFRMATTITYYFADENILNTLNLNNAHIYY